MVIRRSWLGLLLLAACSFGFETASIVLDLRVLGATAQPPELVLDLDPADPEAAAPELAAHPFTITVLVADPGQTRRLGWDMIACPQTNERRCDAADPQEVVGSGTIAPPSGTSGELPSVTFSPSVALVEASARAADLGGFGGIPVMVQIRVWPEGDEAHAIYAAKRVLVSPRLPAERVANSVPVLDGVASFAGGSPMPPGRCADGPSVIVIPPSSELDFVPLEHEGARETYVLPTFDGGERSFVENISYSWYATSGSWDQENTGGADGPAGTPDLDTYWIAPRTPGPVSVWVVYRDERGGESWLEYCVTVR
jgi:hypothetical protein